MIQCRGQLQDHNRESERMKTKRVGYERKVRFWITSKRKQKKHSSSYRVTRTLLLVEPIPNLFNTTQSQSQVAEGEREGEKQGDSPINRQCLSILRDNATFSPNSVAAGVLSKILALYSRESTKSVLFDEKREKKKNEKRRTNQP